MLPEKQGNSMWGSLACELKVALSLGGDGQKIESKISGNSVSERLVKFPLRC